MKTKTKIVVLVEIAIVLCSVFLVAIPAIAAEQTSQEVSIAEVTTASEDKTLEIYGNANEDDTIDMGDVVYTKLAIFGKKPKTKLCDAKYDGRINVLDVIQTKLIILGKEKEITVEIPAGQRQAAQIVTVHKPVERIVIQRDPSAEVLRSLNAGDKIVGVGAQIKDEKVFYPKLSKLPLVGGDIFGSPDYEAILNLNPDLFMVHLRSPERLDEEKLPGVTVIGLSLSYSEGYTERVRLLGYILDKEEEAEKYINWHDEGGIKEIKSRTDALSEDEKPRVFHWSHFLPGVGYRSIGKGNSIHEMYDIAGGIDIAENLKGNWPKVDPEWVIKQNPDIIVARTNIPGGYSTDDPSGMAAARDDILNRLELAKVAAVQSGNVYIIDPHIARSASCTIIGIAYMAKWFHPELFEDLDPQAIHQEYLTRFQELDFDLDEHGVFVYPPLES